MIRTLGRIVGGLIRVTLVVLLLSILVTAAVLMGGVDIGSNADRAIDTPDPLPDWPFIWEIPIDDGQNVDTTSRPDSLDEEDFGDPVREDPGTTSVETGQDTVTSDEIERRIHERVNDIREEHERPGIEHDDEIASIARTHSHDMGERGYFSHASPEGELPADRFGDRYPSECRGVGENIALVGVGGVEDVDEIVDRIVTGWMESEGHRENILRSRWDSEGIGVYIVDGRVIATQNFCEER